MNFWDTHDLALGKIRNKAILIIEEFEGKNNITDKNYYRRLNKLLNRKLGKQTKILTTMSTIYTLKNIKNH